MRRAKIVCTLGPATSSEEGVRALVEAGITSRVGRVTSKDSFIPLGDAAKLVLLSEDEIEAAAYRLLHS